MTDSEKNSLADLLIPFEIPDWSDIEKRYPDRDLPKGSKAVRVAPSPTGFAHFGLLFAAMINHQIAHLSKGIFFLRIEDTDKKREVSGGVEKLIKSFTDFDIDYSEGPVSENEEKGNYGPYIQSKRMEIYLSAAKRLIKDGNAYPCFCSEEKLDETRHLQENRRISPGYYGEFATCRNLSIEEIKSNLEKKIPYTIRFRAPDKAESSKYDDAIKGEIHITGNDVDYVIVKSAEKGLGLPVYHLAAMVDDHLQKVNLVIRGDEWLSSLPLHLQIIDSLGWSRPDFGHLSPIMKLEGENQKRKLSKRKDPEAAASYYLEQGVPSVAIRAYVLNVADSSFDDWRKQNQKASLLDFPLVISHMGKSGALFDLDKLLDISKQEISNLESSEMLAKIISWSKEYNPEFFRILSIDMDYSKRIMSIEREGENKRKDISSWSQLPDMFGYFYDEIFAKINVFPVSEHITNNEDVKEIIKKYLAVYNFSDDRENWFENLKSFGKTIGYADSMKDYKNNPESYRGHVGDVAMIIRMALSGRTKTPDLYEMMQAMGESRVLARLNKIEQ